MLFKGSEGMEMNIEGNKVRPKNWWLDTIENVMKIAGVNKGKVSEKSIMEV